MNGFGKTSHIPSILRRCNFHAYYASNLYYNKTLFSIIANQMHPLHNRFLRTHLSRISRFENLIHFLQSPPLSLHKEEINERRFEEIPKAISQFISTSTHGNTTLHKSKNDLD